MEILPVDGLPEVGTGDRLGELIAAAVAIGDGDVIVVAQKVVSKAEGRRRRLGDVEATARATELAGPLGKDPRLVELILGETERVIRSERVLIVETRSGLICANAGIDSSNVGGGDEVLLLPADPDASARRLRAEIEEATGRRVAVIVSDSFGRPWRVGQAEVAIGCAGIDPADDWRGRTDRDGRELAATQIATVDQLAAAADLVRDKASGTPAAIIRGRADLVKDPDGPGAARFNVPAPTISSADPPPSPFSDRAREAATQTAPRRRPAQELSKSRGPRRASTAGPASAPPRGRRRSGPRARGASRAGSPPSARCSPPSASRRGR